MGQDVLEKMRSTILCELVNSKASINRDLRRCPVDIVKHYDVRIDEGNDPFRDTPVLQEYMNPWDGQMILDLMQITPKCS